MWSGYFLIFIIIAGSIILNVVLIMKRKELNKKTKELEAQIEKLKIQNELLESQRFYP